MTVQNALNKHLIISIAEQKLTVFQNDTEICSYQVSTAKNGIGSQQDSGCTPLGKHIIAQKIGDDAPINAVFVGRVPTGEIYSEALAYEYPNRDWILSRILWLQGIEEGINKGHNEFGGCDTYQRYIYIHGTPEDEPMNLPLSHGCVRMRNLDIVALYNQIEEGAAVTIIES